MAVSIILIVVGLLFCLWLVNNEDTIEMGMGRVERGGEREGEGGIASSV